MLLNNKGYLSALQEIKDKIAKSQYKAILGVNREQILLFWNIGKVIIDNSEYGNSFIETLAKDIKIEFPNSKGYSVQNLRYMRKFAELFPDIANLQVPLADLTWYHLQTLMDKVSKKDEYIWYARKAIENGWSRNILLHQIEYKLYERHQIAEKTTNFSNALNQTQSELARDTLKNPYIFDFIQMRDDIIEKEVENALVANIAKTLMELGTGFAFVGNQYHLAVGNEDFYVDLLFYNTKLRCYVVIELKTGKFKPEYAGKLNFYLSAVDDVLKHESDNPTIGILLCKEQDKITAEYALKDINKPIGVSEYKLSDFVPDEFASAIPSVTDIENRINSKYNIEE